MIFFVSPSEKPLTTRAAPRAQSGRLCARAASGLLTIKLDDQLLVDGAVDVLARRERGHARAHLGALGGDDPTRAPAPPGGLPRALDVRVRAARLLDADRVALLDLERGDVD